GGHIAVDAPRHGGGRTGDQVPRTRRRPEHGDVGGAVAVVVAGDGDVAQEAPLDAGAAPDVPRAGRRPVDGHLGPAVPVVVAGYGDVALLAPRDRRPPVDIPGAGRRPEDGHVGRPVTVEVAGHPGLGGDGRHRHRLGRVDAVGAGREVVAVAA